MAHGLNKAQQDAVTTLSGPLMVLAGAGTGKTRVVTYRIAELIRHGVEPTRILAVTFTNKAAAEMLQRIQELLRRPPTERPVVGTFHSYCLKILRRNARKLGYPDYFTVYDRGDQESLARSVLRDIKVSGTSLRPNDLLYHISRWKMQSIRPERAATHASTDKEHLAATAYRRYQQALRCAGAFDFDDLLMSTEELLESHEDVHRTEASRFDHLLIDEYQDTNGSQYRIVKALASPHRNLCVVGDDDQSIYGWRGAEVQHILSFQHDWPDAKVVRLEENYRSTSEILAMANRLIAFNKTRHVKELRAARPGGDKPRIEQYRDGDAEAQGVAADIDGWLRRGGWEPRDFAILFRTNEQPRAFEAALRSAKLPYVLVGASSFFDRREVRDVLAYIRVLAHPKDEISLLRIINTPPRGIGEKTVELLLDQAVGSGRTVWEILHQPHELDKLPDRSGKHLHDFVAFIDAFRKRMHGNKLAEATRHLLEAIGYQSEVTHRYDDPVERDARWATVEEVVNSIASYESKNPKGSLAGYLDEVTLAGPEFDNEKEKQLQRNAIVLMTLHSAKGLEFPHVYLVGMEEGLLPHKNSIDVNESGIDEERRLCYVGVTRAQDRLTLSMALTRLKWGKPRDTVPSRFLFELIGQADRPSARKPTAARGQARAASPPPKKRPSR